MPSGGRSSSVGELQSRSMQYNEPTSAERQRKVQVAQPVTERFAAFYAPAIAKLCRDELARIRK